VLYNSVHVRENRPNNIVRDCIRTRVQRRTDSNRVLYDSIKPTYELRSKIISPLRAVRADGFETKRIKSIRSRRSNGPRRRRCEKRNVLYRIHWITCARCAQFVYRTKSTIFSDVETTRWIRANNNVSIKYVYLKRNRNARMMANSERKGARTYGVSRSHVDDDRVKETKTGILTGSHDSLRRWRNGPFSSAST